MSESLKERFRQAFVETARERLERAHDRMSAEAGAGEVREELHALSGEASMLAFTDIAEVARQGELSANEWADKGDADARGECQRALRRLSILVARVADAAPGTD